MSNNTKQSQAIGGEFYNASQTTTLTGVNWNKSSGNIVSDMIFSNVILGVSSTNGSVNYVYRRGIWGEVPSGAGEHGNGGSATNVCIGYNAAC